MAYRVDIFRFKNSTEYEYKWAGRYGAKGEKREPKKKPTPEQMKKQNQRRKEKYSKRLMKLNFEKGDLWCTMMYPKGTRKPIEEVKKDMQRFLRKLRTAYKKRDDELKFMYRIEIGSRGGIHIHMLCNHARGDPPIDMAIQDAWTEGRVHFERIKGQEEDYEKLGEYLVKPPNEEQSKKIKERQNGDQEEKSLTSFSSSRNLIRPEPETKTYSRRTVRALVEHGPEPAEGYYIKKDTVISGTNPYTGYSYLYYTEVKINQGGDSS